jgi:hypothetical protein
MTIKKQILLSSGLLVFFLGGCQSNQANNSSMQSGGSVANLYSLNDVKDVLKSQISAWSSGDIDGFMEGYIKDSTVRFITGKRVKSSWLQILNDYKKGYPTKEAMGNLDFILDEVRWLDSLAGLSQVIGRWQVIQIEKLNSLDQSAQKTSALDKLNTKPITNQPQKSLDKLPRNQADTLSGRFSLIFKSTEQGPRIAVDCTW